MLRAITFRALIAVAVTSWALWPGGAAAVTAGWPAPEIAGENWLNSKPLTIADLRGRVVLVEFWTYGCINCRNIVPHLRAWHNKYEQTGLTIVGVHSPEFFWEKPLARVAEASKKLDIQFPVVQDNGFDIWRRYGVRAWPTIVLVDRKGMIRYRHIGEGAYQTTEAMIARLLAEGS